MIEEINRHVFHGESFAFETTLSGRTYANMIPEWQQLGYKVKLVFLFLPDVRIAIERVKNRVRQGGHNVPEKTIRRRYEKGWYNFQTIYKQLADAWVLFDNADITPKLLDKGGKRHMKKESMIRDKDLAKAETALKRAARKARLIAEETKTPLVFYEKGQVVKEFPAKAKIKRAS